MNVLIADDEKISLEMLEMLIDWEALGITLAGQVMNGPELFNKIQELRPEIVVTDIMMPGMTGLEIIAKTLEAGFSPYFIITSAYANFTYARTAMRLGVKDFLEKPIDREEINDALRKITVRYSSEPVNHSAISAVCRTVCDYIDQNFGQKVTLESAAKEVYVSPNYLSSLFKKELGIKFSDYLTDVRMKKAQDLLKGLEYSIEEISSMVGYRDQAYFCNVFQKKNGISPSEFRKRFG